MRDADSTATIEAPANKWELTGREREILTDMEKEQLDILQYVQQVKRALGWNDLERESKTEKPYTEDIKKFIASARTALAGQEHWANDRLKLLEECIARIQTLRNEFSLRHIPLVVGLAKRYTQHAPSLRFDFQSEGSIGLLRAIENFDQQRAKQFSTYAVWHIRQKMQRLLQEHIESGHVSLHIAAGDKKDDEWISSLPDGRAARPDVEAARREESEILESHIAKLDDQAQTILRLISGFNEEKRAYDDYEAAAKLGWAEERFRHRKGKALWRLRKLLHGSLGDDHDEY